MSLTAATVAPIPVERVPLYHWRPGARVLAVGSRDGAGFVPDPQADARTFLRPIDATLVHTTAEKLGCAGTLAWWNATGVVPGAMECLASGRGAVVVATCGYGAWAPWFARVDAWLLLVTATPAPWDQRILEEGRHVEVIVGLDEGAQVPDLPWERAAAVHLTARRAAETERLDAWCTTAREHLGHRTVIYDHHHPHTDCPCGERLVWRHGGRSRLDGLVAGACSACGRPVRGVWA